jgi:acyl-CoA thioesterase-2
MERVRDLSTLLDLERLELNMFRGRNADHGPRPNLYGGQVAAQALLAAAATVEPDRTPHSFHGYFLRAGSPELPVVLQVDRDRDGRSFSARHVVAIQDGAVIFSMIASFHAEREAISVDEVRHRDAPAPDDTPGIRWDPLLEVREVTRTDLSADIFSDCLWVRSAVPLADDPLIQAAALTYLSDLGSGFGQYGNPELGIGGPSIDHSMWFHEPIRADEWVLLDLAPEKARAGRGLYRGSLRSERSALGATIQQEMLLLPRSKTRPAQDRLGVGRATEAEDRVV